MTTNHQIFSEAERALTAAGISFFVVDTVENVDEPLPLAIAA